MQVQSWAKEWFLGFVDSCPVARGSREARFTKPKDHSFTQPYATFCRMEIKLRGLVNYILLLSLQNLILLLPTAAELDDSKLATNELGAKIRVSQVGRQRLNVNKENLILGLSVLKFRLAIEHNV